MTVTSLRSAVTPGVPARSKNSLLIVAAITVLCLLGFAYLWKGAGGHFIGSTSYQISFDSSDLKNLQDAGDVRIAGVKVGTVYSEKIVGRTAHVVLALDKSAAPLHQGATVRIGVKSVIGESFVDLKDGTGPAIPAGTTLTSTSVLPATDIDEVVRTFTPQTRKDLSAALSGLGAATDGTGQSISQLMAGLGEIGSTGYTAIDAIAAQNDDISSLAEETNQILAAMDTNRGAIASMIDNAQKITSATGGQQQALASAVQKLPALMSSARTATSSLGGLSTDLTPVINAVDQAAPDLNAALTNLPSVTQNLRALLPYMNGAFKSAPATLNQVPALSTNVSAVSPGLDTLLRNVNPMLAYIQPYANDIGSFFGDFGGAFDIPMENGVMPARLAPIFSEYSLRGNPLNLQAINPLHWNNPYPAPNTANKPSPFKGAYPHVTEEK